jgi:hypothetical protein
MVGGYGGAWKYLLPVLLMPSLPARLLCTLATGALALGLGIKREDLIKASKADGDPDDPNAGAVV